MRDIAFESAQRCIVVGLVANVEGANIPPGRSLDLSGLNDLVVVDRKYLLTHVAEVLGLCDEMERGLPLSIEEAKRLLGYDDTADKGGSNG